MNNSDYKYEQFMKFLCNHLVALVGFHDLIQNDKVETNFFSYSGWVVELFDEWFWVTAAHCLTNLDKAVDNQGSSIRDVSFMDSFGSDANFIDKASNKMPFQYEKSRSFKIDNEGKSSDFALLHLSELYKINMQANGVKAVTRNNWIYQKNVSYTEYFLLGFPNELTEYKENAESAYIQPVLLRIEVEKDSNLFGCGDDTNSCWFKGKVNTDLNSIVGMSGGPIFGFYRSEDGNLRYHLIAIQSSWEPNTKIIKGCSVPIFMEAMHKECEEFLRENYNFPDCG